MKRKNLIFIPISLFITFIFLSNIYAQDAKLPVWQSRVKTPPMGWNSYDCYGYGVNEKQVKENADYIAKHLKKYGWEYVVIDFCWYFPDVGPATDTRQHYQKPGYRPRMVLDNFGRLQPDPARFPSSKTGKGFKPIADYIHKLGLKFGIHIMRGIPRQAVFENSQIKGTKFTAADIAVQKDTCVWLNYMYGVDMSKKGAQEYYNSLFEQYAQWGVDFVKIDDLSRPYAEKEIESYRAAIDNCKRPIILSTSPGPTPVEKGGHISNNANMWRLLDDLWDNWAQVDNAFDQLYIWADYIGKGNYPDPDMLPLGKLSKYGPVGDERYTKLTQDEQISLFSLWCITRSPLMLGGNLPENDDFTNSLITNEEVLAVCKNSINNINILHSPTIDIWEADVPNSKDKYIAVFKRKEMGSGKIKIDLKSMGLNKCKVRDLWKKKDIGDFSNELNLTIDPHACYLLRLSYIK